ncbi:SRPBCC family protein [Streptomyces sp. NPDC096132]|uniref:SRPBCC family protein n=1 Tax=Streptomyces sp. NPDC096132 TaxID=3366075 RepID=UPI0038041024
MYSRAEHGADLTGTHVVLDDGRPAVRFARTYDRPLGEVWQLVTDSAELAHWFPSRVEMELWPGGAIDFSGDPNMPASTGRVLAVDVPRHLSYAWGGDELRFDLVAEGDGRTRLTLTNVLESADAAARNAAGWEVCLAALDARAEGGAPAPPDGGTRSWEAYYRACVEAGFPSGAPVPGQG